MNDPMLPDDDQTGSALVYDKSDWDEELRGARDSFLEPVGRLDALQRIGELANYARGVTSVTADPEWQDRAQWAAALSDAGRHIISADLDECICGGQPDPDTWQQIDGGRPGEFDWYRESVRRVQSMQCVGERFIRMVVWVDRGGGDRE